MVGDVVVLLSVIICRIIYLDGEILCGGLFNIYKGIDNGYIKLET